MLRRLTYLVNYSVQFKAYRQNFSYLIVNEDRMKQPCEKFHSQRRASHSCAQLFDIITLACILAQKLRQFLSSNIEKRIILGYDLHLGMRK